MGISGVEETQGRLKSCWREYVSGWLGKALVVSLEQLEEVAGVGSLHCLDCCPCDPYWISSRCIDGFML